jgi:phospholipase C
VNDHYHVFEHNEYLVPFDTFAADCANDNLASYSFIEPRYFTSDRYGIANSNHPGNANLDLLDPNGPGKPPPISVCNGEQLLLYVYNHLCKNLDVFKKTLLVVTYDEHGGLFDHVKPPPAKSPFAPDSVDGFQFDRYGVRVPTLFINPRIQPGTIFRPTTAGYKHVPGFQSGSYTKYPFDHTSIISTLIWQFCGGNAYLTERDRHAPTLAGLLSDTPALPVDLGESLSCPAPIAPPNAQEGAAGKSELGASGGIALLAGALLEKMNRDAEQSR